MSKFHFEDRIEYRNKADQKHHYYRPAVEYRNGIREWWVDGLMHSFESFKELSHKKYDKWDEKTTWLDWKKRYHRVDGPAVKWDDGDQEWYRHGKLHREDGPARVMETEKTWYINGKLHREDGPAIEYSSGTKEWYRNGKLHREDGPALEFVDGAKGWYLNGVFYKEEKDYWQELKNRGLVQEEELVEEIWPKLSEYAPGITCEEYQDGTKQYFDINRKLHREDGPAVEWVNGDCQWKLHGKLHREDGPAIEYVDGHKEWYINGRSHRIDGPAYEGEDGVNIWFMNGKRHREDGPAIERPDGTKEWYINGEQIEKKDSRWGKLLIDATQASLAICLTAYLSSRQTQETEQNLAPEEEICTEWGGHIVLPVSQMENA